MNHSIWHTIAATPWWMYVFCVYIFWVAFMATKPRLVSIKAFSAMPLFFTSLSIMAMCAMLYSVTYLHLVIWISTLFLGTGLGFLQLSLFKIKAIQQLNSLYFPGSWMVFVAMLISFSLCFYFNFPFNLNPQIFIDRTHALQLVFIYGLATGLFLGRFAYALRSLRQGPFTLPQDIHLKATSH